MDIRTMTDQQLLEEIRKSNRRRAEARIAKNAPLTEGHFLEFLLEDIPEDEVVKNASA